MPNWCTNSMKITGATEEIARFKQTCIIGEQGLDFNALIPMPARSILDEAHDPMPKEGTQFSEWCERQLSEWCERDTQRIAQWKQATNWDHPNNWASEHWVTKWNACKFHLGADEANCFSCSFDTAWAPPIPVWEKMGEMFPTLEFELSGSEPLCDFAFKGTIHNGQLELLNVPVIWETVDPKTGETVRGTADMLAPSDQVPF